MVQLIKKGGLRERANRSRSYNGSENTETTLKPNRYQQASTDTATQSAPQTVVDPVLSTTVLEGK